MNIESVEKTLSDIVEKRAKGRAVANIAAEGWKASTRQRRQRERRENALAWASHYSSLARAHHDLAAEMAAKADAAIELLEDGE